MIVDNIIAKINEEQKNEVRKSPIRASASGYCARKIGYQLHEYPSDPLPARSVMTFRLGDIIEAEVKSLIAKYLPADYVIECPQEPCSLTIAGREIQGHVDGVIKAPVSAILEVKSINTMGFKRLDTEGVDYSYKCQAVFYQKAMGIPRTVFIYYDKNTSHLKQITYEFEEKIWQEVKSRWENVIASTKDKLPDREYEPNAKGALPWNCTYCSFMNLCWKTETTFTKAGKPILTVTAP
jgi:hypothetical protein